MSPDLEHSLCPAFIKVVGFGDAVRPVVDAINELGYDGLDATVADIMKDYIPSENDRMVILLVAEHSDLFQTVARTYFDADVLTVGIFTETSLTAGTTMGSFTIVPLNRMYEVVRILIAPIFMQGYISYDFNDLRMTLANTGHFLTLSAKGCGELRFPQAIESIRCSLTKKQTSGIERISVFIYSNKGGEQPLKMQEVLELRDYLKELPENIDAIWATYPDDTIKGDEIKISIVAAGKEIVI